MIKKIALIIIILVLQISIILITANIVINNIQIKNVSETSKVVFLNIFNKQYAYQY